MTDIRGGALEAAEADGRKAAPCCWGGGGNCIKKWLYTLVKF
jgi:hypothetical protein